MKILQVIDQDSRGIVRLQVKFFLRRPEWVFGEYEKRAFWQTFAVTRGRWCRGYRFRSASDGKIHAQSPVIAEAYSAHLSAKKTEKEAEAALNRYLEMDDVLPD